MIRGVENVHVMSLTAIFKAKQEYVPDPFSLVISWLIWLQQQIPLVYISNATVLSYGVRLWIYDMCV